MTPYAMTRLGALRKLRREGYAVVDKDALERRHAGGRDVVPKIGSVWEWEPLKDHARCTARVTDVKWNGEEWWIESSDGDGMTCWNELSRWVEATVLVDAGDTT